MDALQRAPRIDAESTGGTTTPSSPAIADEIAAVDPAVRVALVPMHHQPAFTSRALCCCAEPIRGAGRPYLNPHDDERVLLFATTTGSDPDVR
jgi:hypothetical protein